MWGLSYYLFLLPIMQWIKCPPTGFVSALCNEGRLEDSAFAFKQIAADPVIIAQYVGIICSISLFNVFGISTTKFASAAQRSTIDTSRTVLIWICSCSFLGEKFQPWSIIGFVLLIAGTLIYNEIIEVPCLGFNEWTKKAIKARKAEAGEYADNDLDYIATSPHAAYDSNRNKRVLSTK